MRKEIITIERNFMELGGLNVYYGYRDIDGIQAAQPVEFKKNKPGEYSEPFLRLSDDTAQVLIDQLWIAGLRPSGKLIEPRNLDHMEGEVSWLRDVADHLMKRTKP